MRRPELILIVSTFVSGGVPALAQRQQAPPRVQKQPQQAAAQSAPATSQGPLSAAAQNTNRDAHFKGPNPGVDITRYGARAVAANIAPAIPGITANINSSSNSATISNASTFQNGDGVTIFGAGAPCSLSTPTGLTVTPSLAAAGTGTGIVANAPSGGTTTYNYQVVARNKAGCLTAASSVATTRTGNARLGAQSVAAAGFTRSGTTVTATTSSAHGLSAGSMVYIFSPTNNNADNLNFGGWYVVNTVPDKTHFTYATAQDAASGALTVSNGGGTVNWFNCNHLSWTPVTGAFEYYIYGREGGHLTLLGVSKPQAPGAQYPVIDATWDDFGSPMMDGILMPFFVPSTPPGSALANPLVTTIASGAGTTTLKLAASARTTVRGATILFDNTPNIQTAANAVHFGGLLYFPLVKDGGSYVVNSYLTMPTATVMSGGLYLNDSMEIQSGTKIFGMLGEQGTSFLSFGWPVGGFFTVNRANPGIFAERAGMSRFDGIQISTTANGIGMHLDGTAFTEFKNVNFSQSGTNDYMGMGLVVRGTDFFQSFDHVSFIGGPAQTNGISATPLFLCRDCGTTELKGMSLSRRGIFFSYPNGGAGINITFKATSRMQGGITPFFTVYNAGGTIGGTISFEDVELDTMNHARFSNLSAAANVSSVTIIGGAGSDPSTGFGSFTGRPVGYVKGNISGQNFQGDSGAFFTNNTVSVNGTLGSVGYLMSVPAAPISAVVSAGGAVSVGTHTYRIVAIDAAGNSSAFGLPITAVTTTGNQTVTITPPASVPVGTVGLQYYRDNGIAGVGNNNCGPFSSTAVFVDTLGFQPCNNPTSIGRGVSAGLGSTGLVGQALTLTGGGFKSIESGTFTANRTWTRPDVTGTAAAINVAQTWSATQTNMALANPTIKAGNSTSLALTTPAIGGETISASPRSGQNVFLPGALTSTWTGATWTTDKAVTITRLQVQAKTAPAGCTTNAIVRLTDGTTPVNITISAATNDSGAISQNYAAASSLQVLVETAAAGCTTSPADANVTVQYRMQ